MYPKSICRPTERGHTLIELVIVLAFIAIVAAVALPRLDANDDQTLDLVAADVAAAFRFARTEAMRRNEPHGVHVDMSGVPRLRVYWLDKSGFFPMVRYQVNHPLTKGLYELRFDGDSMPAGSAILGHTFTFAGASGNDNYMGFDSAGMPKSEGGFGGLRLLESAALRIGYRTLEREIHIEPLTGRVTVQ